MSPIPLGVVAASGGGADFKELTVLDYSYNHFGVVSGSYSEVYPAGVAGDIFVMATVGTRDPPILNGANVVESNYTPTGTGIQIGYRILTGTEGGELWHSTARTIYNYGWWLRPSSPASSVEVVRSFANFPASGVNPLPGVTYSSVSDNAFSFSVAGCHGYSQGSNSNMLAFSPSLPAEITRVNSPHGSGAWGNAGADLTISQTSLSSYTNSGFQMTILAS